MIRFPHEIKGLLTKARRIRRKMKARAGRSATAGHKGKTRKASTRMRERHHSLLREVPQPHQPKLKKTMAQSRKPRSSSRAGEEPRMRRRRHSLLQKMPQPQQPMLKKTMANSTRWTGGVQSLPAPRQTKTRSPPKAQALMGESSAERTLRSPSPGRAAEARHTYQWFYVLIWGRRDPEHSAGVQEDDKPGSPAHGQYNWYKNT